MSFDKDSYIREYYRCQNKYLYLKKLYNQSGGDDISSETPPIDPEVQWCQTIKSQMNPEDIERVKVIYRTIVPIRDRQMYTMPMPPENITPSNFLVYKQIIYNFINSVCREAEARGTGDSDGDPTKGAHIDPMVQWCQNSYSQINVDPIPSLSSIYQSIPKDKQNIGGIHKPISHINNRNIFIYKQIIYNYIDRKCGVVHEAPAPPPDIPPPSISPSGPPKVSLEDRMAGVPSQKVSELPSDYSKPTEVEMLEPSIPTDPIVPETTIPLSTPVQSIPI